MFTWVMGVNYKKKICLFWISLVYRSEELSFVIDYIEACEGGIDRDKWMNEWNGWIYDVATKLLLPLSHIVQIYF